MDQTTLVDRLLAMAEDMAAAASLADWTRVAALDAERAPLVRSLTREQSAESLAKIRRIQAIDNAVFADARVAQAELQAEYGVAMTRASQAGMYQQGARL